MNTTVQGEQQMNTPTEQSELGSHLAAQAATKKKRQQPYDPAVYQRHREYFIEKARRRYYAAKWGDTPDQVPARYSGGHKQAAQVRAQQQQPTP